MRVCSLDLEFHRIDRLIFWDICIGYRHFLFFWLGESMDSFGRYEASMAAKAGFYFVYRIV